MKFIRPFVIASTLALLGSAGWAEDAHHPEAAASAAKTPKAASAKAASAKAAPVRPDTNESLKKMDQQMMDMRAMHDKMMSAKTPEERSALMTEHMKAMQGGMAMMGSMLGTGKDSMKGGMPSDMATHHQMMEKRMEMMETMMQMMMDRLPPPAAR